jgi:ABC-type multidrug transport system fused ATPase/permease subunit
MHMSETLGAVRHYPLSAVLKRLGPLLSPHRWRCLLAMILVGAVGLAVALQPLFAKYVFDVAIPQRSLRLALAAAAVFIAVMFVRMALWFWAMSIIYDVHQLVNFQLRAGSFAHLQRLCLRFHNQYSTGFLYERVFGNSIVTLGYFIQAVVSQLTINAVGLLFSLGFCLYLSPTLTLVILAGGIAYVVVARHLSGPIYVKTREANEASMHVVNTLMDKLRGIRTTQAMAAEQRMDTELQQQLGPAQRKWMVAMLETMKLNFVTEGLGYVITAAVLVVGATLVLRDSGRFPLGTLVAFMGYQGMFIGMISAMTGMYGQFMSARTAFDQLYSILDTTSTLPERAVAVMPANVQPRLTFSGVKFAYGTETVLNDVSFDIPASRMVALVGRSGSGKSTLANLALRFYDPAAGAVLLDGHDIRDLPLREYRALFGVVLQDPFLFDTTIEENLHMARPNLDRETIIKALRQAGAWEFVEKLDGGLQYRAGEGGSRLSGGQRQRLALTRCLLTNSRLIILDEATSALDVETEANVQHGIDALRKDRTVIVIAHRLSTIRRADLIVVLDQGQVVEQGTFEELLEKGGHFARLHAIATSTSTQRLKLEEAGFA